MNRLFVCSAFVILAGCGSTASYKVASAANAYEFREARYEEKCTLVGTPIPAFSCVEAKAALDDFRKHIGEALKAVKNGGDLSLQLAQLRADEKRLKNVK